MLNIVPFSDSEKKVTKKLVWLTDLHLDAAPDRIHQLLLDIVALKSDMILVGGDTSNGHQALNYLLSISKVTKKDIYFVLGNHEFYHHSISETRELAQHMADCNQHIHYLTKEQIIEITPTTALIGHDGWSDARAGNFMTSTISLHDYTLINDLKDLSKIKLKMKLHQLGKQAAYDIQRKLQDAFQKYSNVIILTHTPPFQASCLYDEHISDDNWAPHFVCKAMGDVLLKVMNDHSDKQAFIFCGHAHTMSDIAILPNLRVIVGESTLGSPQIQGLISV